MIQVRPLRPLLRVTLPVALAAVFVCLAVVNIAVIKTWRGHADDGVLWRLEGANVVAVEVAPRGAGAHADIRPRDVLLMIDGREIRSAADVADLLHTSDDGRQLVYTMERASAPMLIEVRLSPMPLAAHGLYYSLALVGILAIIVGASVRLRRPTDPATLHFFWLTVAFFGVLAFSPSGRYDRLDYFFEWADMVARLALPPMFVHFSLVFPERPNAWIRTDAGRALLPVLYLPALLLGGGRAMVVLGGLGGAAVTPWLQRIELLAYAYLSLCLLGGLILMVRALTRLRSVTARRQLRWILWGSTVGAVPFVVYYVVPLLFAAVPPYAEYTAVLLGCIPLAFASAIVRYRLMDIEVIVKKGLVAASVVLVLSMIYGGTREIAGWLLGSDRDSAFWGLFATLVAALVAPGLWRVIQTGLDRLYYRDRYDYRRALVSFARDLNSDLDLDRLSTRLVERVRETLGIDRIALYLPGRGDAARLHPVATSGFDRQAPHTIAVTSALGARVLAGHTVVIDDPVPARRLGADETAEWRDTGLQSFVPCVSKDQTIGVIAAGRRPPGESLSSEDMSLLGAVAAQAATALENARLYGELKGKAHEIERLRQFSDSVVESLTDGLVVVDLDDRVLRWNRRMEAMVGVGRGRAVDRRLSALFSRAFLESLQAVRRESPSGTTLFRVPLGPSPADPKRLVLVNAAISPFQTDDGQQAGWIIVLEDVTDRAGLEEQLRLSEKMAAIGLLAAGVAHEVNTPLTGISSFTQMLLERADPADPRTQLLEKIERQTFRAAKIINSLLNLARPSGGDAGPVDLNVVVSDVLSLLEHQLRAGRVQVRKDLVSPAVIVRGVEYKIQQVFLNLFLNARDAMPKGGWLSVTTRVDGDTAIVEVGDTGAGIPAEHLARIYDPFFTTKPEGRGTGLGLSVTYGIVQEHNGTLTCDSRPGEGTTFRLVLPLADRGVEAQSAAAQ